MTAKLSEKAKNLIDRPNFAHLATLMPDGSPHSTPIWVGREDDHLVICTPDGSLKARNTKREPRVSLSIVILTIPTKKCRFAAASSSAARTQN